MTCSSATEPQGYGTGMLGGCPCTSVRGSLPLGLCVCDRPLCHVVRRNALPQGDSVSPLASAGARICSGGSLSGDSAALYCGSSKSALPSVAGMAGVPVLTTGERCVLTASEVVDGGGNEKVRDSIPSCMARWLTPDFCSLTQGSLSPPMLAVFMVASSSSISCNSHSSGLFSFAPIKTSCSVPARCTGVSV